MSISSYKTALRQTESPRSIERRILTQITSRLKAHQEAFDSAEPGAGRLPILAGPLREAIAQNSQLWLAFSADLMTPGNTLPAEVRAGLLSLARFVERHSAEVLRGHGSIKALIDVNVPIIASLHGQTPEAA